MNSPEGLPEASNTGKIALQMQNLFSRKTSNCMNHKCMPSRITTTSREIGICSSKAPDTVPVRFTSNLSQLQCFTFILRICKHISPKDEFNEPFPYITHHSHTIKEYQEGICAQPFQNHTNDLRWKRERSFHQRLGHQKLLEGNLPLL